MWASQSDGPATNKKEIVVGTREGHQGQDVLNCGQGLSLLENFPLDFLLGKSARGGDWRKMFDVEIWEMEGMSQASIGPNSLRPFTGSKIGRRIKLLICIKSDKLALYTKLSK